MEISSSTSRQLPGDWRSERPCQCRLQRNPCGCRAWSAHCRGDSHLQSLFAWVSFLQRLTQGPPRPLICTFRGRFISGMKNVLKKSYFRLIEMHDQTGGSLCRIYVYVEGLLIFTIILLGLCCKKSVQFILLVQCFYDQMSVFLKVCQML